MVQQVNIFQILTELKGIDPFTLSREIFNYKKIGFFFLLLKNLLHFYYLALFQGSAQITTQFTDGPLQHQTGLWVVN